MTDILLVSETTLKDRTNISDNVSGKLILPAIRSAQEKGLREILGDNLMDKIKALVASRDIELEKNSWYKKLIIYAQDYLCYSAVSDIVSLTAAKIDNAGNQFIDDEKMTHLDLKESFKLSDFYQQKADFYCKRLQNWLIKNRQYFRELSGNRCSDIRSNLYSSATCGLVLGGPRGKNGKRYARLQDKYEGGLYRG